MSYLIKSLTFVIFINIFMTIAGVSLGGSDVLNNFIDIDETNNKITPTTEYNASVPQQLSEAGLLSGVTGTIGVFIDGLKTVWNFLMFVLISLFAPLYWGFVLGFPIWLQLIFVPIQLWTIIGLIMLIRGVGN